MSQDACRITSPDYHAAARGDDVDREAAQGEAPEDQGMIARLGDALYFVACMLAVDWLFMTLAKVTTPLELGYALGGGAVICLIGRAIRYGLAGARAIPTNRKTTCNNPPK